ncbi:MAG TPA: nucleotidyl transferase AbiEii/AbiGii toxin family protein [Anaeromyxobacteraceae bacterium]|nr:nucleotidyl transferase AbiEii/AbiGii toxin family protein [Anaeromyxobacteraceae bacterium]
MKVRRYTSPAAFKAALDQRLRNVAEPAIGITRRRQLLVFDRYLARLIQAFGSAATLKGGLVLELRLARARTTRDIDLRVAGSPDGLLLRLQEAGRLDLGDYMSFEVRADARHPEIAGEGVQYQGQRFRAECRLAGMLYGQAFGVDVAFGDPMLGEPEVVVGDDLLAFAGIAPPELRVYPVETHVAEKLHAYTLPRATPSTRVKDLPDLALLGQAGAREARKLRAAFEQTFTFRKTHAVPARLPDPPMSWEAPYAAMAEEDALPWPTLAEVTAAARAFLDPVLASPAEDRWDPEAWNWTRRRST